MRLEILIFLVTVFFAYNHFFDGKILNQMLSYKKHYQTAGILFVGFFIYWVFKYRPKNGREMLSHGRDYLAYLPIDSNSSSVLSPILDFTTKMNDEMDSGNPNYTKPILGLGGLGNKIPSSGGWGSGGKAKRSVSESTKKQVAAAQNWKCKVCLNTLSSLYECDHTVPLCMGGSNDASNLQILCPNCHRSKTQRERVNY